MMAYSGSFASAYDVFNENAQISMRADFVCELLEKNGVYEGIALDLACGTGRFGIELSNRGYDVIGVDISPDMLMKARENAEKNAKREILFLCQDMTELDLYGTVDCCVCCTDSLNHLDGPAALERTISKVGLFIRPGGAFIFDVNTLYKHKKVLAGNTFVYEDGRDLLVWQNSECENGEITLFLDQFTDNGQGLYTRHSEEFREKAYKLSVIKKILKNNGFKITGLYGDMTKHRPGPRDERVYFAAKKI